MPINILQQNNMYSQVTQCQTVTQTSNRKLYNHWLLILDNLCIECTVLLNPFDY